MSYHITIDSGSPLPKYQQIADCLLAGIKTKCIGVEEQLPSINEISAQYDVSRDTVERAYKVLKRDGVIQSVRGKGYYATATQRATSRRVLVLFPKLSERKQGIFEGLGDVLGASAELDLQLYGGSFRRFEQLIIANRASFSDFVIMADFVGANARRACEVIGEHLAGRPIVLVNNPVAGIVSDYGVVSQEFHEDIVSGLGLALEHLRKYSTLYLLFDPDCSARGIISGFLEFAERHGFHAEVETTESAPQQLSQGTAYLTVCDKQLAQLVKAARDQQLKLGQDVGIVSYNDSVLKEVLAGGITVVTTDHRYMGQRAGEMLLSGEMSRDKVPFKLISRATL